MSQETEINSELDRSIYQAELILAIAELKAGKASGVDQVVSEVLMRGGGREL